MFNDKNNSFWTFISSNEYNDNLSKSHISRLNKKMVKNIFKYLDYENEKSYGDVAYRKTS